MKYALLLFLIFLAGRSTAQRAGDLDSSFGTNGSVILNDLEGLGLAVYSLPTGAILAAGNYYGKYGIFKFNANGSPDGSFNGTGMDTFTIAHYSGPPLAMTEQPDGKILTTGLGANDTIGAGGQDAVTVRFNPNGGLDNQFNGGGVVATDVPIGPNNIHFNNGANAIALQMNGKIVVAGQAGYQFTLIRYNTNGSLDSTFGNTGIVINQDITNSTGNAVAIQPDGKIIIAGSSGYSVISMTLLRYDSTGILDSTFGINGIVQTYISGSLDVIVSIAVLSDGRILAGGYSWQDSVGYDFAVVRYNQNGSIDSTFGTNGIVVTDLGNGENDDAYAMAVQPDGKIVLAGRSYAVTRRFALVRYLPDGSLDTSFGNGGKVVTAINGSNNSEIWGMALQSDGDILVCGHVNDASGLNHFAVARYLGASHVGVQQINAASLVSISPNPNTGTFSIKGDNIKGKKLQITITNMFGQVVATDVIQIMANKVNSTIQTGLSNGIYIVSLSNETGLQSHSTILIAH